MSAASPAWRYLLHLDLPGARQMAIDEALLLGLAEGSGRPVLRLYSWRPACVSLGYGQASAEVDLVACERRGIDVVRRASGGRAVLHDGELTYAVVAPVADPAVGGSLGQTYRAIADGLLAGVRALGVEATLAPGDPAGDRAVRRSGACFAAASRHEIVWQGRKLIGSAQVRRGGVLVQHGSLPLTRPATELADLLRTPQRAALNRHLAEAAVALTEAGGRVTEPAAAAPLIAPVFAAALGISLEASELTPAEVGLADRLERERYAASAWTLRR